MFTKIRAWIVAHKIISTIIIIVVAVGGYYWYGAAHQAVAVTKYVVQDATTNTVVESVSGSGQVEALTQIDVKPQVSETVTNVLVQPGDTVAQGQVLVQLDPTNEQQALAQAQLSLQSAELSLANLQTITTSTLTSDQDAVTQAEESLSDASTSLPMDYQTGFNSVVQTFIDFQNLMTDLQSFVTGNDFSKTQNDPDALVSLMPTYLQPATTPYEQAVETTYQAAVAAYAQNFTDYQAASQLSPQPTLDSLFAETYNTATSVETAIRAVKDMLDYIKNNYPTDAGLKPLPAEATTIQTNFAGYTGTISGDVSSMSNLQSTITSDHQAIQDDVRSLTEKQEDLTELTAGPSASDLTSQQLSLEQAQNNLTTAQDNLADTSIRAPIAGIVSVVDAIVGETVPSPAVSMVGGGNEAQITLNEVDAAKVLVGQSATLTFDAFSDLSLAGQVIEIDPVGTVSQGVVNYNVEVGFTQPADTSSTSTPEVVKPGMSVTANIDTQVDQDVVAVPNASVVTVGTQSYVLEPATPVSAADLMASATGGVLLPAAPKRVPVTVGISNDTVTEITSGVNVGDQIITQTITTSASTASAAGGTSALSGLLGGGARTGAAAAGGFGGGAGGFTRTGAAGGGGAAAAR